jgi:hypothetical protein
VSDFLNDLPDDLPFPENDLPPEFAREDPLLPEEDGPLELRLAIWLF